MTRKNWMLLGLALGLGAVSLYINSDWFKGENIQIVHRPVQANMARQRKSSSPALMPILFNFDRKLALTEVQVFNWAEIQTNKYARPLWHMVSDSNSVPTLGVVYGSKIPGMRPVRKEAVTDPILPGVKYRLVIHAGSREAQHDFIPSPVAR